MAASTVCGTVASAMIESDAISICLRVSLIWGTPFLLG
jgi:hypothetical protein